MWGTLHRPRVLVLILISVFVCITVYKQENNIKPIFTQKLSSKNYKFSRRYKSNFEQVNIITDNSFFFIETSESGLINSRQMCAVESTAKLHPDSQVYLLLSNPPENYLNLLHENNATKFVLEHYANVRIVPLNIFDFLIGSPLENFESKLKASKFPLHHTSDILRILTLWKYGGIYLDLDFVITKTLGKIKNFVCAQSDTEIANGALGFDKNHPIVMECLKDLEIKFDGESWAGNGPGVITRAIESRCGTLKWSLENITDCKGVSVLPPHTFYAVPWPQWERFFNEEHSEAVLVEVNSSRGVHVWNKLSGAVPIKLGSRQAYGVLAEEFCPLSYLTSGNEF